MYSKVGLEHGIERCLHNIEVLEVAVEDERKTIADYRIKIEHLEKAEREMNEAKNNVRIEIANDIQD